MSIKRPFGVTTLNGPLLQKAALVKLVVCDLDGTLLNDKKEISQRNLEAIARANERGIMVTICSGRIFTMLEAYVRTLDLNVPLISANGAVVVSPQGEILSGVRLDTDDCYKTMTFAMNEGLDYIIVCDEACYYTSSSVRVKYFVQYNEIAAQQDLDLIELIPIPLPDGKVAESWVRGNYPQFTSLGLRKILIYELDETRFDFVKKHIEKSTGLMVSSSDPGLLDIVAEGVDKGRGLALLARHFGLKPEEVMVFGDFDNDLSMFEWAGFPVAMGNAITELKEHAIYITDTNTEDGVAQALEQLLLGDAKVVEARP